MFIASIYRSNYIFVCLFCILWPCYLNVLINPRFFFSSRFSGIVYLGNKSYPSQIGIVLFLWFLSLCFLFSCLISLAKISSTVMTRSDEMNILALFLILGGEFLLFKELVYSVEFVEYRCGGLFIVFPYYLCLEGL